MPFCSCRPPLPYFLSGVPVYLLELTAGIETNIEKNSNRKATKYKPLLCDRNQLHRSINFVALSMSALGIFNSSSDSVMTMMDDLGFDNNTCNQIIKKSSTSLFDAPTSLSPAGIKSGTSRVLEIFAYKTFHFFFISFYACCNYCLDRQSNNTLPVISKVCHCNLIIL